MLTPVIIMTFLSLLKYGIEARKVRQAHARPGEAQDTIIISMSALVEARDRETGSTSADSALRGILARHLQPYPNTATLTKTP